MRKTLFLFFAIYLMASSKVNAQLTPRDMTNNAYYGIGDITSLSIMTNYEVIGTESSGILFHYVPSSTTGWFQNNNGIPALTFPGMTYATFNKVLATLAVGNMIYASFENKGVYRLNTTGTTWNWVAVNSGLPSVGGAYNITTLSIVGTKIVAGTNAGQVYSISNTGVGSWTVVSGISTVIPSTAAVTQIISYSDGANPRMAIVAGKKVYLRQTTLTSAGTWGTFNAVNSPVPGGNVEKLGVIGSTYKLLAMTRTYTPDLAFTFLSRYNHTTSTWSTISSLPYSSNYLNTFATNGGVGAMLSYYNSTYDLYKQNSTSNINAASPGWIPAASGSLVVKDLQYIGGYVYAVDASNIVYKSTAGSFREKSEFINDELGNSNVTIYPNPTTNQFQLLGNLNDTYNIIISDLQGRTITQLDGNLSEINSKLPSASNWNKGMYILQVHNITNDTYESLKLVKGE